VNGEKERGTLRLTFANAVPRGTYIVGKMIGSIVGLGVPLLVPILLGTLMLTAMGIALTSGDWVQLGLIVAAGLLFFVVFLTLSIFVSAMTDRSSNAFLLLLTIWVLSVMIWPRASVLLAGRAVDVPDVDELNAQKGKYNLQLWEEDRRRMAKFTFAPGAQPQEAMQMFQKFMSQIGDDRNARMTEFAARLNEERANKQRQQERLALTIARLSPSAVISLLNMSIAGTGLDLKEEFKTSAENYQTAYGEFIKQKTGTNPGGGMVFRFRSDNDDEEEKKAINPNELPAFEFAQASMAEKAGVIAVDFGILGLYSLLFFAGAFVAFLRYDVR
jgi:ABC-2 type transport system permease protein